MQGTHGSGEGGKSQQDLSYVWKGAEGEDNKWDGKKKEKSKDMKNSCGKYV